MTLRNIKNRTHCAAFTAQDLINLLENLDNPSVVFVENENGTNPLQFVIETEVLSDGSEAQNILMGAAK